jgi:hypothetical protein
MSHQLFDVWEDDERADFYTPFLWHAQLVDNVAQFTSRAEAEQYVAFVKKTRDEKGLK